MSVPPEVFPLTIEPVDPPSLFLLYSNLAENIIISLADDSNSIGPPVLGGSAGKWRCKPISSIEIIHP
jgi:hypothetical protein